MLSLIPTLLLFPVQWFAEFLQHDKSDCPCISIQNLGSGHAITCGVYPTQFWDEALPSCLSEGFVSSKPREVEPQSEQLAYCVAVLLMKLFASQLQQQT